MQSSGSQLVFGRNILPPSLGSKSKRSRISLLRGGFLLGFLLFELSGDLPDDMVFYPRWQNSYKDIICG
jgi:hypothetical protein